MVSAGLASAWRQSEGVQQGKKEILLERNKKIGCKLLLTGDGWCNLTNTASLEISLEKSGKNGSFYRDAFIKFSNDDLIDFFRVMASVLSNKING